MTRHPSQGQGWCLLVPAPGLAPGGPLLAPRGTFLVPHKALCWFHSRVGSFPLCHEGSIQDPPLLSECVLSQDFVIRSDGFSHHLPPPPGQTSSLHSWSVHPATCPEGSQFGGGGQVGLGGGLARGCGSAPSHVSPGAAAFCSSCGTQALIPAPSSNKCPHGPSPSPTLSSYWKSLHDSESSQGAWCPHSPLGAFGHSRTFLADPFHWCSWCLAAALGGKCQVLLSLWVPLSRLQARFPLISLGKAHYRFIQHFLVLQVGDCSVELSTPLS